MEEIRRAVTGPRGERSMLLRTVVEGFLAQVQPKDYLSEILGIRNMAATFIRYANDGVSTELVKDPQRLTEEIVGRGRAVGDCDDIAAWILAAGRTLGREGVACTVGFGRPGHYSHVFACLKEPKTSKLIACDPVAGSDERGMLQRVKTYRFWEMD